MRLPASALAASGDGEPAEPTPQRPTLFDPGQETGNRSRFPDEMTGPIRPRPPRASAGDRRRRKIVPDGLNFPRASCDRTIWERKIQFPPRRRALRPPKTSEENSHARIRQEVDRTSSVAAMTLGFRNLSPLRPPPRPIPGRITDFTAAFSAARSLWASWAAWSPRNTATPVFNFVPLTIAGATISVVARSMRAIEPRAVIDLRRRRAPSAAGVVDTRTRSTEPRHPNGDLSFPSPRKKWGDGRVISINMNHTTMRRVIQNEATQHCNIPAQTPRLGGKTGSSAAAG